MRCFLLKSTYNVNSTLVDFWLAGFDTTASTMAWGILLLINWPECQQKAQDELDRVIGSDRLINLADKKELPYCNAVVNEIQRLGNISFSL